MIVYAAIRVLMRATSVLKLYTTEASARQYAGEYNELFPRGARATVTEMQVHGDESKIYYGWGIRTRSTRDHAWGAVWEAFEDEHMDAEDRAKQWLEHEVAQYGRGNVKLVRQPVHIYPWEDS